MIRWIFLVSGIAAFVLMISFGTQVAIFTSFGLLFVNFATFCLQYEGPMERARTRVHAQLGHLTPNSDAHQRMSTAQVVPNDGDRMQPRNAMTLANLVTGIGCVAFMAWGVVLWLT